jgi:hypothetical protein
MLGKNNETEELKRHASVYQSHRFNSLRYGVGIKSNKNGEFKSGVCTF